MVTTGGVSWWKRGGYSWRGRAGGVVRAGELVEGWLQLEGRTGRVVTTGGELVGWLQLESQYFSCTETVQPVDECRLLVLVPD